MAAPRSFSVCREPGRRRSPPIPQRRLIGDDEHGWSERGIFNFENGSYAKTIGLSAEAEPDIFRAAQRFGSVLENVVLDPDTRRPRFDDDSLTENTRAAYPLAFLDPEAGGTGSASVEDPVPLRGCVRCPATGGQAHPRPGALLVPLRIHREACRHRTGCHRPQARRSRHALGRRSCRCRRCDTPACLASGWTGMDRKSGSSIPAGPAVRTAPGSGCRSV